MRPIVLLIALSVATALAACPKMKKRAEYNRMEWTAEVNEQVGRLFQALERHHHRARNKGSYRFPSAGPTPAHIPCGRKPHPASPRLWRTPGWKALDFTINEPIRYQYQVISSGQGAAARFTIRALGDLDCDGVYSTFERAGSVNLKGRIKDHLLSWDKQKELE